MIPKDDNFIVVNGDSFIVIAIQQLSVKYTQAVRGPHDSRFFKEAPLGRLDDMLMDTNLINAVKNRKNEGNNNSLSPFSTAGNNNNWEGFYYCPPSPLLQPDLIDFRFNLAVDIRRFHMSRSIDRMDAKRSFGEQSRLFDRGNPSRSSEFGERQKIIHGFAVEGIGECHATIIVPVDGEHIKRRGVDVSIVWIVITDANEDTKDERPHVIICKYAPHVGRGIFVCAMLVGENGELSNWCRAAWLCSLFWS
eukprot:scaffold24644_cov130-Skeletonema_dohrnii-CCMP3373.AAC.1